MLGYPHPDYLLPLLTARQLHDWQLWMRKFVPTPNRNDPLWAMSLCMFHNANCDRADKARLDDFMPYYDRYEEEMTLDDLKAKLGLRG